ncbi:MAG TPA: O-antigen ligase family protein [Bryobacteraceae bacterium]
MPFTAETQDRMLLAVAVAAAGLIQISIAASQLFLGLGIVLLLVFRHKLEFPRIWVPLACFFLWTVAADVLCPSPWGGRAQIRKFFVFLLIPLVYGVFRRQFTKSKYLIGAWVVAATASGAWALVQFGLKYEHDVHAPGGFYIAYLRRRIDGFESHWMTFGGLQMSVLLLLLALFFFSNRKITRWAWVSVAILCAAILLGWTRSVWLGALGGIVYLVWRWRPKMTLAIPVIAVLIFFLAPPSTRQRMDSFLHPRRGVDSNQFRVVIWRTGLQMIEAHPWFGIGPEEISREFKSYVPADIPRPLPPGYYGHLHNIYLQYSAERGVPAMLLMLWLIGMALWDCVRGIQRIGAARSWQLFLLHGTIAVTVGILIEGFFEYNLGDSEVLMMFVSVVSLGYATLENLKIAAPASAISSPEPAHADM